MIANFMQTLWPEGENPFAAFYETLRDMLDSLMRTGPMVLIWLLLLVLGWVLFKLLTRVISAVLSKAGVDGLAERAGVSGVLSKMGISKPFSGFVGIVLFWLLFIQFTRISSERFGLDWLTDPLNSITAFLPHAITAFIIVVAGYIVADVIRNVLFKSAEKMGLDYARALSSLAFGFLLLLVIILAVRELGIETSLLEDTVKIAMVGVSLAIAICLGLGLHQMARNVVSGVYARDLFPSGSQIEFDGELTDVVGVGSVTTKLRKSDGAFVMVPNKVLLSEVTRGRDAS